MRHFSVFASRALVLICALALPFAMTEQGATAARAGASRGMAPSLRGVTGMPDGRRPATLAQRRAQVRRELADSDRIRRLASQHAKMTVRRMTQAEPQAELQAARRDAARREIIAAGGARAARHPLRVAAPRSPKSGTASGVISGMEGSNVLSGPQGLVAWDYSVDSAFEVPPLPGYPLPDVRFPDWAQQSGFFPGETLTFTTAIYNDSTTDQPVHVTWRVDCGATQVGYDLGQNVTAPPVPGLLPGAPPPPAPPGPQGAIVSFTFQVPTLFSQQCQGNNNLGPWPFEVWVDATVTSPGGGDNLGVQVFAGDVTSMGQPVGCPGSPDSAAAPGAHGSCGDPVDTASGQYAATFTDARITGPGYPLAITRSYSSAESAPGPMGPGWSLPWQANLSVQPNGDAVFTAENGDQHYFASNGNGTFTALPGALSVLAAKTSGTTVTGYTLTAPDHHVLAFNASGQLQSVTDATGRGITLGYAGGQVTSLTDAAGDQATLSYTGSLLSKVTLPDGHTIIYGYTTGLLTSVTTPGGSSGLTTTYAYNAAGLLASIQDPDGHYLVRNTYNSSGQVISQQDGTGAASGFSYATLAGGLTEADVTDPNGGITTHIYGGGLLLQAIAPLGGTTSYAYNSFFEQIAVTDPLGNITTMSYDASGHLTSVADPLGNRRRWAYDASGNLASYADANGNATTYAYNSMDEPTSVTSSSGGMTTYAYGSAGNLVSSVDPRGNVSGANPADYTTTYGYDSNGRLTSVTSPDGAKTSLTYDAEGYLASAADPLGRVTSYAYDAGHRLTKVTAPDGGVTAYGFDGAGNLTSRTDPDGRIWTYAYDAGNRLSTATDPLGNISAYTYDGNGNQVTFTDARGIMSTTSYDANGRPAKVTYSDGTPAVSYAYNGDGDATGVTDGTGTRTLSYDSGGQLVKVAGPGTGSFAYGYDPAGNVTSRAYPDGKVASYTYTAGGQVGSITSGAATITYSYDAAGNLVSAAEPGGVTESRGYNNNGQLTGISYAKGATVLDSYGLTLNAAGQPSQVAVVQDGTSRPAQYYSYDTAGRLASACVSSAGSAACSSASAGTATGTAPNPAAPGAPNGMVTSGIAGKCLDDSNGGTANGNKVDIYSCNGGTSTQLWTIESNGTFQIGGKCLDVHSSGTANGTLVDSYGCNGTGAQQWKAAASQGLQNPESGKCLDDPSGSTTNGTQLDINSCSSTAAQRWQRPYNGLAYAGELTSGVSGKCLDNSGAGTSNGNQVDIVSCDGGTGSQLWTVRDDGTVRIQNKCLDVKSSSTANGTLVDLYGCNGTGAQQWVPAPFGYLINPHSGKCLDDPSSSTTNGTQLDIFTCNGASGQKWTLPSTTVPAVPTSVSVTAGAAAATLLWTPPASTGGVPLTGYTVTASPGGATASAGPYATSATVAGLTPGTAYTFTVTAASTIGSATTRRAPR